MIEARAEVQNQFRHQRDRIERISGERMRVVLCFGCGAGLDDRRRIAVHVLVHPRRVRVGIEQAGAIASGDVVGVAANRGALPRCGDIRSLARLLPRNLGADSETVFDAPGLHLTEQIGLVDDAFVIAVARLAGMPDIAPCGRRVRSIGAIDVAAAVIRHGEDEGLIVARPARGVAQRDAAEIMLDADGALIGGGVAEIARGEPVIGVTRNMAGRPGDQRDVADRWLRVDVARARRVADRVEIGDATVRQLVAGQVIISDGQPGRRAEADG